jgi:hypothetical protein
MRWARILAVGLMFAFLGAPIAHACPLCADAIANSNAGNGDDEADQFPSAMNQSIYLMLAVPYAALGVVGVCIYRGVKKNEEFRRLQENQSEPQA